jgi:regulator of RNase E activity RraA
MDTVQGLSSIFDPAVPVVSSAFTVKCPPGDNIALKVALTMTEPGDVIVVDAQGSQNGVLGGFQISNAQLMSEGSGDCEWCVPGRLRGGRRKISDLL